LVGVQGLVELLGGAGQRVLDPADRVISRHGHDRALPMPPRLQQGMRDQRQHPRLSRGVSDKASDQRGFHPVPSLFGRAGDHPAQLVGHHRANEHLRVTQRGHQLWILTAVVKEVRPDAEHHAGPAARVGHGDHQRVNEPGPLLLVTAQGEELLELVDDQHDAGLGRTVGGGLANSQMKVTRISEELVPQRRGRLAKKAGQLDRAFLDRVLTRREHHNRCAVLFPLRGKPSDQAGAKQRGLATTR